MIKETIPELQKLSTADKFALAVELWDELSSNPDEMPVTEEQLNELDRRFEEYRQDPDKVVTWEKAKGKDSFRPALTEVVLLLSAERDLQEAYDWGEEHRRGREQFFLEEVAWSRFPSVTGSRPKVRSARSPMGWQFRRAAVTAKVWT